MHAIGRCSILGRDMNKSIRKSNRAIAFGQNNVTDEDEDRHRKVILFNPEVVEQP